MKTKLTEEEKQMLLYLMIFASTTRFPKVGKLTPLHKQRTWPIDSGRILQSEVTTLEPVYMVTSLQIGLQVLDVTSRERRLNYQNHQEVKKAHYSIPGFRGKKSVHIINGQVSSSLKYLPNLLLGQLEVPMVPS